MKIIIMGVAGCGKSSVGAALAAAMDAEYCDGDDLHPASNIEKMSSGIPLNDNDRAPWLDLIGARLAESDGTLMIGCSALKKIYRDRIRAAVQEPVTFLHLTGTREVIEGRMSSRPGHFMPVALLDSQFSTLEPLQPDELSVLIDINQPFDKVVGDALKGLT